MSDKNTELLLNQLEKLNKYFNDPGVREILLQADGSVIIYSFEGRKLSDVKFSETEKSSIAKLISHHNNKSIHFSSYSLSGKIDKLNCRVHIIAPPLSSEGTVMSFRKRANKVITFAEYLEKDLIDYNTYKFLIDSVLSKKNIIIAGSTGSGKTTLLNALIDVIPKDLTERLYIVEDNQELICSHKNRVMIYIDDSDIEAPQKALAEALRMSPDRIIYGELRNGYVAMGLLNAWNTGHDGGLSTVHASSGYEVVKRLKSLAEQVAEVNCDEELICSAVDLIIFIEKIEKNNQTRFIIKDALNPIFIEDKVKYTKAC